MCVLDQVHYFHIPGGVVGRLLGQLEPLVVLYVSAREAFFFQFEEFFFLFHKVYYEIACTVPCVAQ